MTLNIVHQEVGRRRDRRGAPRLVPDPTPREVFCPIISPDDHVMEPPGVFQDRVQRTYRDRVPRIAYEDGFPYWVIDDVAHPIPVMEGGATVLIDDWTMAPARFEEMRRGLWDSTARVSDMDVSGIWASLCFPSGIWGFAGRRISAMADPDVALASVRAYNDWMYEEWCGAAPERFIPCQIPWLNDPAIAAEEIRRNADRGFVAVSFAENPERLGLPSIHTGQWDPFLAACEETGTAVNLHVGGSGSVHQPSSDSPPDARVALFPVSGIMGVVDWIYSRIPLRFPALKIVLSEAGMSWVPMIRERLERAYRQVEFSEVWSRSDPSPVDVLRRSFWYTSIEDPSGFRQLDEIGEDKVMVECDYPHPDSSWPDLQTMVARQLAHLPPATVRKLCFENAAALYRHPLPPADMIAGSVIGTAGDAAN